MSDFTIVLAVADDAPGCGFKWPPRQLKPPPHNDVMRGPWPVPWVAAQGPYPVPWVAAETFIAMHVSIRIAQAGRALGGEQGDQMTALASAIFDERCGNIPVRDLIAWLLHHPPPPPPPYLEEMLSAARLVTTGRLSRGQLSDALEAAGLAQLSRSLDQAQTALKQ
jgi:hypothetical protein